MLLIYVSVYELTCSQQKEFSFQFSFGGAYVTCAVPRPADFLKRHQTDLKNINE